MCSKMDGKHISAERKELSGNLRKFLCFRTVLDQESRTNVNVVLDQLNAEACTVNLAAEQNEILDFFNKGCSLIPTNQSNGFLLSKFFQLVEKFLLKQKIQLDDNTLNNLVGHVISSTQTCPSISVYDNLKVLGELVFENGGRCGKFYEDLLGVKPTGLLLKFTDSQNVDMETQKTAITCIGNLCIRDLNGSFIDDRYAEISLLTLLNVLQTHPRKDVIKIEHCKLINTLLKAIQDILPSIKPRLKVHLGQLLLTIKNYLFYGFPGYELTFPNRTSDSSSRDSSSEPDDLSVLKLSLTPIKERAFPGRGALKKKPRHKRNKRQQGDKDEGLHHEDNVPVNNDASFQRAQSSKNPGQLFRPRGHRRTEGVVRVDRTVASWREMEPDQHLPTSGFSNAAWAHPSSSESEFSDSESGQARRLRSAAIKVRNSSLVCLQSVIKNSAKRELFGFWSSFISDGSGALTWSLFTIIQSDPNPKNRTGATTVLMDLLDGSKLFLAAADDSEQHQASSSRPFTSFSSRLGSIIHELHRLVDVIATETSLSCQVQLVKCLAMLVLNCPYQKLQQGLLTKVVETIRPLLSHNDLILKQTSLVCLGAVLTVNAPMTEVTKCLEDTRFFHAENLATESTSTTEKRTLQSNVESGAQPSKHSPPWLVYECFQILRSWTGITKEIDDHMTALQSEALHLLIVFTRNYFALLRSVVVEVSVVARECLKEANPIIGINALKLLQELGRMMYEIVYAEDVENQKNIVCNFWLELLNGEMIKILQSKDPLYNKCKAAACDCLSDIGANVLNEMPLDKRLLIITMLLGLANDDDTNVKAASIRALGVYIVYAYLREDVVFVTDTANTVINGLNDSTLLVRVRAAWSLANLSNAFVMNRDSDESTFVEDFPEILLLRLINISLKACEDNEKVKSNIVRALGNFAKYLSEADIEKQCFSEAVENIFRVLAKCILNGQMKTRWNACYAAGNVFSNHCLPTGKTGSSIQTFDALLSVVNGCKNFKVRINAVNALAVPLSRCCYGDEKQFAKVWSCLADTLAATKDISDFSEFKYRDTLRHQITSTICHVTSLITPKDLEVLIPIVTLHHAELTQHLISYYQKQLKLDEESMKTLEGNPTREQFSRWFLNAYDHVLTMKGNSVNIIRSAFAQAKQVAEEHMQQNVEQQT